MNSIDEQEVEAIIQIFTELVKESRHIDDSDFCITSLMSGDLSVSKLLDAVVASHKNGHNVNKKQISPISNELVGLANHLLLYMSGKYDEDEDSVSGSGSSSLSNTPEKKYSLDQIELFPTISIVTNNEETVASLRQIEPYIEHLAGMMPRVKSVSYS